MTYTPLTYRAMHIAYNAHHGQVDKAGVPYIFHPMHLAEQMDDELSTCVALLHDVAEDSDITLDDLKAFRQIDSKTPGHPEVGVTPGVDCSTGPLGQGIATAVGMAIGETILRSRYNVIDYYTYVLCGDGDLMEGVSYEAASIAGNLQLDNLIVLYDSNRVTLDGELKLSSNNNIRTILDVGGQDSKVINIDEDGNVINFIMNDKCAAGTGRFLQITSNLLGSDVSNIDILAKDSEPQIISSMCTVFAESEIHCSIPVTAGKS